MNYLIVVVVVSLPRFSRSSSFAVIIYTTTISVHINAKSSRVLFRSVIFIFKKQGKKEKKSLISFISPTHTHRHRHREKTFFVPLVGHTFLVISYIDFVQEERTETTTRKKTVSTLYLCLSGYFFFISLLSPVYNSLSLCV